MCATSFVFSKEHKTFPLRGIQTTAGIHRLKIHSTAVRTKCLSQVCSCYQYYVFYINTQACIVFYISFNFFLVSFFSLILMFSLWELGAKGWAGAVFSLFPVQTLGELGLGRGEVISRSNCKVDCRGGTVEGCRVSLSTLSHMHIMSAL